ncbi:TPA: histone [Candidatus Bathyarchaeota archaeon]|nr:histone [Candidatus Bathyarchaeota archaeon]
MAPKLGLAAMHKMIKRVGGERIRVSEKAAGELGKILEHVGSEIAREAIDFALHAGRKTVKARDIRIAYPKVMVVIAERTRK